MKINKTECWLGVFKTTHKAVWEKMFFHTTKFSWCKKQDKKLQIM